LTSEGRRLADKLRERLCVVLLVGDLKGFGESLSQFGVDKIYHVKTEHYETDAHIHILSHLLLEHNPKLLLIGMTPLGNELAPRIAARNEIGIITDCQTLELNDRGCFEVTKMIHGDKVYATYETPITKTLIVTVTTGTFDLTESMSKKAPELVIENVQMNCTLPRMKYLEVVKADPQKINISEAEIIIAVGGGVGSEEELKKIERLAEVIGGSLGGSRVAVDRGWLAFERQIGQTGKTVSPKLIVCCGISGAFEFIAGMKDSRLIVAINKDAKAPIFRVSNLSLIGDVRSVIPEIIKRVEKHLQEGTE
jgi:electron transfer flavoprotein alpha subunit